MKKIISKILTVALVALSAMAVSAQDNAISVKLNGQTLTFDVQPQIINNRTMVPMRGIFEALDATVEWDGATQTITSTKDDTTITLTINSSTMYVNDKAKTLDSPACVIDNRTLVPIRAVSEAFGTSVTWYGETRIVSIHTRDYFETLSSDEALKLAKEKVSVTLKGFSAGASNNTAVSVEYINHTGHNIKLNSLVNANNYTCYNSNSRGYSLRSGYSTTPTYYRDAFSRDWTKTKDMYLDNNSTATTTFELGGNTIGVTFGVNGCLEYRLVQQ